MSIVSVENLTKTYGSGETAVRALDHVSFSVDRGEFVAIMGPSGCGKSTMLHLLGGLDRPTEGSVSIGDTDLSKLSDAETTRLRRREIGFVFQFFNLIPVLTATENAALPLFLDGKPQKDAEATARGWLERVGLGGRLRSRPDELSGGQQQRVAIARALAAEPKLVLADEPTGNLDSKSADEIAGLLRQVASEWDRAVIMVTHDPRIAAFSHRLIVMSDGRIISAHRHSEHGTEAAEVAQLLVEQAAPGAAAPLAAESARLAAEANPPASAPEVTESEA